MNKNNFNKHILIISLLVIATYIILIPTLGIIIKSNTPLCIYSNILHINCWGCGMTRAFYSFLIFEYKTGISYNFLIILVFPLTFLFYTKFLFEILKKWLKSTNKK